MSLGVWGIGVERGGREGERKPPGWKNKTNKHKPLKQKGFLPN